VVQRGDEISLWPSVWVEDASCGSHFILRDSRVDWVTWSDETEASERL
jgi:hypothetical protein